MWLLQDMQWTVHKGGTESKKDSVCWNGWEGRFGVLMEWPLLSIHHKTVTRLPSSHDPLTQVEPRIKPVGLKYPHPIPTVPKQQRQKGFCTSHKKKQGLILNINILSQETDRQASNRLIALTPPPGAQHCQIWAHFLHIYKPHMRSPTSHWHRLTEWST